MATSPDSSSTVARRQRPSVTHSPAAAGTRRSPRPVLLQPSPPVSHATNDEPSSSATRPMPALPKVKIPSFRADAEDGDGEGYRAGEDGDADEWSEAGSDWWLPDRFDGEEFEEWNAGDEE
ncbi:unnamed protein product [Closterium sp. NIES-53]